MSLAIKAEEIRAAVAKLGITVKPALTPDQVNQEVRKTPRIRNRTAAKRDSVYKKAIYNGLHPSTVYSRVYGLGWSLERALALPTRPKLRIEKLRMMRRMRRRRSRTVTLPS